MSLDIAPLAISDVKVIRAKKFGDARGFFSEVYNRKAYADAGIVFDVAQVNVSLSATAGTVRGLHAQREPLAQAKLVRVPRGRIWDVAVDARRDSPTFGRWVAAEISAQAWDQIFIPAGFLHGFRTLEPDTEVEYKVSNIYSAQHEFGVRWDDPDLAITWPVGQGDTVLSDRDRALPSFKEAIARLK